MIYIQLHLYGQCKRIIRYEKKIYKGCFCGLGTRTGSTVLFSTTARFCDIKQRRNYSLSSSRSIKSQAKRSDRQESR